MIFAVKLSHFVTRENITININGEVNVEKNVCCEKKVW
jgi:hypothetical protein